MTDWTPEEEQGGRNIEALLAVAGERGLLGHIGIPPQALARAAIAAMQPRWRDVKTDPPPRDTVILTDEGTATWHHSRGWCLSTSSGSIPSCADWGQEISEISPSVWMLFPPLPPAPETQS